MSKRSFFLIAAALGLLASVGGVGSANAGTITQTFTNPATTVPYSVNFAASQFNPSLGTLSSVEIVVTSDVTGVVQVLNTTTVSQAFSNATASVPVSLSGPNSLSLSVTATTTGQSGTVGAATSTGPTVLTLPGATATVTTSTTLTSSAALAPYIGTGSNNLSFTFMAGQGTYTGTGNSGVFFGGSATADATVEVIYNFMAVPEPASMSLLGIGMAGFFAFRRFFNKRNADV